MIEKKINVKIVRDEEMMIDDMERVMEEMKKSDLEKKEKVRIGRRKGINEEKKKMGINLESLYEEM